MSWFFHPTRVRALTIGKKALAGLVVGILMFAGVGAMTGTAAQAAETNPNCTAIGDTGATLSAGGVGAKVPKGMLCLGLNTKKNSITELRYSFGTFNPPGLLLPKSKICNYWVDFKVLDRNSKQAFFSQGELQTKCVMETHGSRVAGLPIDRPVGGTVCATLWRNGGGGPVRVGAACTSIT